MMAKKKSRQVHETRLKPSKISEIIRRLKANGNLNWTYLPPRDFMPSSREKKRFEEDYANMLEKDVWEGRHKGHKKIEEYTASTSASKISVSKVIVSYSYETDHGYIDCRDTVDCADIHYCLHIVSKDVSAFHVGSIVEEFFKYLTEKIKTGKLEGKRISQRDDLVDKMINQL